MTIQIEGNVSICEEAKFIKEQQTQRESFSPLSNGSNNNTYLQACEDQIKDWRRTVCAAEPQDIFCEYQVRWLP